MITLCILYCIDFQEFLEACGLPTGQGHSPVLATNCNCLLGESGKDFEMSFLVLRAYLQLIQFDLYLARGNFARLYEKVRQCPVGKQTPASDLVERICSAVDTACIWYWKEALCLQRSAATACLLKRSGVPAQLVIGAQQMPFRAHAWVEVVGRAVNDKSYMPEIYAVTRRCRGISKGQKELL